MYCRDHMAGEIKDNNDNNTKTLELYKMLLR